MKAYLTFGAVWTVAGTVLLLVLYLLGFHSDPAKLTAAQIVAVCGGLAIATISIVLGTKARRAQVPPTEDFGYGSAFGAGFMITLFAALFNIVPTYAYTKFINPEFVDVIVEAQSEKLAEKKMSAAQIEEAEKMIRAMSGPGAQATFGFFGVLIFGTIISLITAAVLKRPDAPASLAAPPPLA